MGDGQLWIRKHHPHSLKEVPQTDAVKLENFVRNFSKQKKKALLLYGPSGTCKSSAVHALARDLQLEIVEVNASDTRNEEQIEAKLGQALKQRSLLYQGKIILIDEVDGISGTNDRGGLPAIVGLIATTKFPIVLTAQDPWDKKFSTLRSKCVLVEFPSIPADATASVLQAISSSEGINADAAMLKSIARRSGGDLRSAVNDLQLLTQGGKAITNESIAVLGERNKLEQIENALVKIFRNSDPALALGAFDQTDTDVDEVFLWLDHNLAKEYANPEDRVRAYDILSKADVFRGRIRRRQHWRFLSHIFELLTAGIAVAKDTKSQTPPKYERSQRLLKIWMANMKYGKRSAIAHKLAEITHSSTRSVIQNSLPWLQAACRNQPELAKKFAEELDLDEEELLWLMK